MSDQLLAAADAAIEQTDKDNLRRFAPKPPIATDSPEGMRKLFEHHALTAFKRVEHSRHYALDDRAKLELCALAVAFRDIELKDHGRCDLEKLPGIIKQLAQVKWTANNKEHSLNLTQSRPGPEIELKPVLCPVTQAPIKNPYADKPDLASQAALERENAELAKYYEDTKAGVTFAYLQKRKEEREHRDRIRAIVYGEKQHVPENNPFLLPHSTEARKKQSDFVRANEHQPHIVNWFEQEAKAKPTLGFGNLTMRNIITKRDAKLGEIYERAQKLHAHFLKEDQQRLEQEVQQRQAELRRTQAQLAAR